MGKAADRFFTIGKTGTNIVGNPQLAADSFASKRALLCRASIDPDLLDQLATAASAVQFVSNPVEKLGHRWIEQPSRVGAASSACSQSAHFAQVAPVRNGLLRQRPHRGAPCRNATQQCRSSRLA